MSLIHGAVLLVPSRPRRVSHVFHPASIWALYYKNNVIILHLDTAATFVIVIITCTMRCMPNVYTFYVPKLPRA